MPALSITGTPLRSTIKVAVPAAEQLLDVPLERFGGAAGHEGLHRRHDETIADRPS